MNREEMLNTFKEVTYVKNTKTYIGLVDVMGEDKDICQAARTSYGEGTKSVSEDRHLIRYLMRHYHSTPIQMCEIKLLAYVPLDLARQIFRHRVATYSTFNEYSTRYSLPCDDVAFTEQDAWRLQAKDNKQGSADYLSKWPNGIPEPGFDEDEHPGEYLSLREKGLQDYIKSVYEERLAYGIAKEQARKDLSLSNYTKFYWKCDLWNMLHFLQLRLDEHAQIEIRQVAEIIANIVKNWVPYTWEAYEDYRLNAITFSSNELKFMLNELINRKALTDLFYAESADRARLLNMYNLDSKTERIEFIKKLKALEERHEFCTSDPNI